MDVRYSFAVGQGQSILVEFEFNDDVSLNITDVNINFVEDPFTIVVDGVTYTSSSGELSTTTLPGTGTDATSDDDDNTRLYLFIALVAVLGIILILVIVMRARSSTRAPSMIGPGAELATPAPNPKTDGMFINRLDPGMGAQAPGGHYYPGTNYMDPQPTQPDYISM